MKIKMKGIYLIGIVAAVIASASAGGKPKLFLYFLNELKIMEFFNKS